ncbi:MAG TPA: MBL fold metallo-hydrolase [Acidobacteriota bacterium]|nr:MBL fold metallo-hydrolase [Acidobacteriota bacterium]
MELGPNRYDIVSDGVLWLDGGAMCGVVPRPLWSKVIAPDEMNRIPLATNCLLARGPAGTILVETGVGRDFDEKQHKIFNFDFNRSLLEGLSDQGVAPEDVDMVIQTHLHFDHCGNLAQKSAEGNYAPTFPRAEVVIQRGDWESALDPDLRTKPSYYPREFYKSIEKEGLLRLVDGETELAPGVRVLPRSGHTVSHQIVQFGSGDNRLVYLGDFIPMHYHLRMPYIMAFDLFPLTTLEHKLEFLPQAASQRTRVVFEHDVTIGFATLLEKDGQVVAEPIAGE